MIESLTRCTLAVIMFLYSKEEVIHFSPCRRKLRVNVGSFCFGVRSGFCRIHKCTLTTDKYQAHSNFDRMRKLELNILTLAMISILYSQLLLFI